jgi:hypothetical protein
MKPRSLDDLPDVIHSFRYCVELADLLVPEFSNDLSTEQRDVLGTVPGTDAGISEDRPPDADNEVGY